MIIGIAMLGSLASMSSTESCSAKETVSCCALAGRLFAPNRLSLLCMNETSLYAPVKRFLEGLDFVVKGEIGGCDIVALRDGEPPIVVICELKLQFNLELVLQGVDRATSCDEVWLAARM